MRYSFVTLLTTSSYLPGVLVLNESLRRTKTRFPLTVLATENLSAATISILDKRGITVLTGFSQLHPSPKSFFINKKSGFEHYSNTFSKLHVFGLTQFDKIVYLDCDILILENIDELFDRAHLSAVVAGKSYPGHGDWSKLNSGVMVIVPERNLVDRLLTTAYSLVSIDKPLGDQDVIQQFYPDWPLLKNLHLSEEYNVFDRYLDFYVSILGYSIWKFGRGASKINKVRVVHFIGQKKPWMLLWRDHASLFLMLV